MQNYDIGIKQKKILKYQELNENIEVLEGIRYKEGCHTQESIYQLSMLDRRTIHKYLNLAMEANLIRIQLLDKENAYIQVFSGINDHIENLKIERNKLFNS